MPEKLKDLFFTQQSIHAYIEAIQKHYPDLNSQSFLKAIYTPEWESLELKAKMRHVTHALFEVLPSDYTISLVILLKAAPEIKGFEAMTLPDFVEVYGMGNWEESLNALGQFTRYSSSEFAIRPFLDTNPEVAMFYMKNWAKSDHENVRRFASEGCRPRLPWAMVLPKFVVNPEPVLEVLEILKDDPSEFVRKSVANNLNDISKDNPEMTLETAIRWFGSADGTNWIVKHGLRTLLKKGNVKAMRLFGFGDPEKILVTELQLTPPTLKIGDSFQFSFRVNNTNKGLKKVRLEYAIDFVKSSGKRSKKIFQLSEKEYKPGIVTMKRKHSFADLSTRKHYPGDHQLSILVNGVTKSTTSFLLNPALKMNK